MADPRIITIVAAADNHFTIHEGERYCPGLCWDEMLGSIAELTHPAIGGARYRMETPDEHAARRDRYRTKEQQHTVPKGLLIEGPKP